MYRLNNASLHIKDSGTSRFVAFNRKWTSRERAFRENGVVVPDDQNLWFATANPVDMRAGNRIDQCCRRAQTLLQ